MEILIIKNNKTLVNWELKTLKQKYDANLELVAKHINADTKLKKITIFTLANLLYVNDIVYAANPSNKIDTAGNTILGIVRRIGYWICIIGCIIDIVKTLMQGDTKSIAKVMLKYTLAFSSLYVFPWILDLIRSVF